MFGKQHQHTFKNDMRVLTFLYARETVQLLEQETPDFISPDLCPPNRPVIRICGLVTTGVGTCVQYIVQTPVRDTSRCDQGLEAAPHWHMGKHITKRHRRSSWSMRQKDILWTSAKVKPALYRANTLHNRLFPLPPTVYPGKHVVSRHFHRSF